MGKHKHVCEFCGKNFYNYFEIAHYCSKDCFHAAQKANRNSGICPTCGKEFHKKHSNQIFCSVECKAEPDRKRIKCVCDNCGKEIYKKPNEYNNANNHFCSMDCKRKFFEWTNEEIEYLKNNYGTKSYVEMEKELTTRSASAISDKAISLGIANSRVWSDKEEEIVKRYYSTVPFDQLQLMLPNRTKSSIMGKARSFGLIGYYTLQTRFTKEETEFIRNNYLIMSDEDIAKCLNKTADVIMRKRHYEKLSRPKEAPTCYDDIIQMLRSNSEPWRKKIFEENNYTCQITGKSHHVVIHHRLSFNILVREAINEIDFSIKPSMSDYTADELSLLLHTFLALQNSLSQPICINENLHKLFHKEYGYGDNTPEQFDDFLKKYYAGIYDEILAA